MLYHSGIYKASRPAWFPDWPDDICAIIGSGPSARDGDIGLLRDKAKVVVVNRSWELAPWADVLYAADQRFWDVFLGVPDFHGMKVTAEASAARQFGLHLVSLLPLTSFDVNDLWLEPGILARGGHSGHQAINFAVQFGARKIMLIGFDCCGEHWHGRHPLPLRNPKEETLKKWRMFLDKLKPSLSAIGVDVVNCSQISKLTAYPKMSIAEALEKFV